MGLEQIIAAIEGEAAIEVARIRTDTDSQVLRIESDAQARADEEQAVWEASRVEEARRVVDGIVNRARLVADRRTAEAREGLFQEALRRLRLELAKTVEDVAYDSIMLALYREAAAVVADPVAAVLVRAEDAPRATELLAACAPTADIRPVLACVGGLDLEAPDGRAVRNTFDARLAQSERRLRRLAVEMIPQLGSDDR